MPAIPDFWRFFNRGDAEVSRRVDESQDLVAENSDPRQHCERLEVSGTDLKNRISRVDEEIKSLKRSLDFPGNESHKKRSSLEQNVSNASKDCQESKRRQEYLENKLNEQQEEFKRETMHSHELVRELQRNLLCAEEKARRQSELHHEAQNLVDAALEENSKLLNQLSKLQFSNDDMDDDTVRLRIGRLYQSLDTWVKFHYAQALSGNRSFTPGSVRGPAIGVLEHLSRLHSIYFPLSVGIFKTFLWQYIIGLDEFDVVNAFRQVDARVQSSNPESIHKIWHLATHRAIIPLTQTRLENRCTELVRFTETYFAGLSHTECLTRTMQLKNLLWEFIAFKQALQQHRDSYEFMWVEKGSQFSGEWMESITGEVFDHVRVEYCISPALLKRSRDGGGLFLEKAKVKVSPRW